MCASVIGLFMGPEDVWIVADLHCRIRSGVTPAKPIENAHAATRCTFTKYDRAKIIVASI
jgi:hypothetical protein